MMRPSQPDSHKEQPLWENQARIHPAELLVGHFVAGMDRDWNDSPFLIQGQMIESPEHKDWFERHCAWVVVDLNRSLRKKLAPKRPPSISPGKPLTAALNLTAASGNARHPINRLRRTQVNQPAMKAALRGYVGLDQQARRLIHSITKGGPLDVAGARSAVSALATTLDNNLSALVWLTRIKQQDNYTAQHCINVAILSMGLARALEWDDTQVEQAGLAGLLHDLGKMRVNLAILNKPGKLTPEEFDHLKQHSQFGYDFLKTDKDVPSDVAKAVLDHHERPDGRGYPNGKKLHEYSAIGALVAVVDAYDAITSHRVYDAARSHHEALSILWQQRETQFEGTLVEAFIQFMGWVTPGTLVRMTDDSIAVVLQARMGQRLLPVVQILVSDESGYRLGARLDLAKLNAIEGQPPLRIAKVLPDGAEGVDLQSLSLSLLQTPA